MATEYDPTLEDLKVTGMVIGLADMIMKVGFMVSELSRRTESDEMAQKTLKDLQEVAEVRDQIFREIKKLLDKVES